MVATTTPLCSFGLKAADFELADPDGRRYTLQAIRGKAGTLVMFLCNHCPYVRAVVDRLVRDVEQLQRIGMGAVAIMSNDYRHYPEDAPTKMKAFARDHRFSFPYLVDETQEVARAYNAVCTPDFFGFNADLELQYRGRLDDGTMSGIPAKRRELLDAMQKVAATGHGPELQNASIGCSIKWRAQP